MKEHWEVLYELYREGVDRQGKGHTDAMAFAIANWAQDFVDRRPRPPAVPERCLRNLMETVDGWNAAGTRDWRALREGIRHAWTDGVLGA